MTNSDTQYENRRGAVGLVMALSLVVVIGFAALGVDLAYMHYKRSDLQKAADAAALAGASALLSHRGSPAAIKNIILDIGRSNLTAVDTPASAINSNDIAFYVNGKLQSDADEVEVRVMREEARNNPVDLFFANVLGIKQTDLGAMARAGIVFLCSTKCIKPFIVPTKFTWDDFADPSNKYYGNGELDVDSDAEMATINVLGYDQTDIGTQVTLKFGNPKDTIVPSHYSPINLPPVNKGNPVTGASAYKENIAGCEGSNNVLVELNDEMSLEPGNMSGPTEAGLAELVGQDPYAYWDTQTNSIVDSLYDNPLDSPRVSIVAFYDPRYPPVSGRTTLKVYQLGAVFVENTATDGSILARFINAVPKSPGPDEGNCMLALPRMMLDSSRDGS